VQKHIIGSKDLANGVTMKSKAKKATKHKRKAKEESEEEDDLWKFEASYKLGIDKPTKRE